MSRKAIHGLAEANGNRAEAVRPLAKAKNGLVTDASEAREATILIASASATPRQAMIDTDGVLEQALSG